ncbi:ATP synthase F1 subunit gamma [Candidatus Peregrinibacteria bacterium CG08_land_8_20_14_0_20_41_10]|nr:MAG: ATP synthase F1 subunit gamma [Candidatus Peregrinibacteria bacterium CG08_land_8_20_14_0_20_41_10]
MPASTREIQRRTHAIQNIEQITHAMQMVAASRMRRAQQAALRTRVYAEKALEILINVSVVAQEELHPLLQKRDRKRSHLLILSADRGLCGGLNLAIFQKAQEFIHHLQVEHQEEVLVSVWGKKARDLLNRSGVPIYTDYSNVFEPASFSEVRPVVENFLREFLEQKYERAYLIYPHFVSTLSQKVVVKRVIPLGRDSLNLLVKAEIKIKLAELYEEPLLDYLFEPNPRVVLNYLLPKLIESQFYQAVLETRASEHSARMVAMKNATEAATEIIDELTLTYNRARQANITQEMAEILGGAETLKNNSL